MPKSIKRRNLKGGSFIDSINDGWNSASQKIKDGWNVITNDISDFWNKNNKTSSYSGSENSSYANPSYSSNNNYTRGGKKRSKRGTRSIRGGYSRPIYPNLASQAAPYHGTPTARVKWIGGKKQRITRKKNH